MQIDSLPAAGDSRSTSLQWAAAIIVFATVAEMFLMAHHPSFATADVHVAAEAMVKSAGIAAWVHGGLIALALLIVLALSEFVLQVGPARPLIRGGAIAYTAGVVLMIGGALVNGFVVPDVARSLSAVPSLDAQVIKAVFTLCGAMNRTCIRAGVLAMSAGIALWSVALMRDSGWRRLTGVLGLLAALVLATWLLSGEAHLNVLGMGAVLAIQGVWYIAVAVLLLLRR